MNERQVAGDVIRQMGIEPRFYSSIMLRDHECLYYKDNPDYQKGVKNGLCRELATCILEQNMPLFFDVPEEEVYKNVPRPTGNIEIRAELIVFNPDVFTEFIERFAIEITKHHENKIS